MTRRSTTGLGRRVLPLAAVLLLAGCASADGAADEESSSEGSELAVKSWTKVCSAKRGSWELPGYYGKTMSSRVSIGYRKTHSGYMLLKMRATVENPWDRNANNVDLFYVTPDRPSARRSLFSSGDRFPDGKTVTLKFKEPLFIPGGSKLMIKTTWDHGGITRMDFSNDGDPCELQFF